MQEGTPPKNPELSSGGRAPCSTGFPCQVGVLGTICIRAPAGLVVRGLVQLQWIFYEDSFNASAHFTTGNLSECTCPYHAECWAVFDQKWHDPSAPPSLVTSPEQLSSVSPDEKGPQTEVFCRCERGETKNGRSTKRHQNQRAHKLVWAVEKSQ